MGFDVSGVVAAVGADVKRFKVGDAVFSRVDSNAMGTFAEFVSVDEQFVAEKPANLSHQEAAALPLVALTSWQALFDRARLKAGQKVLIHAGAGGIGSIAIQLAKAFGLEVATTTSTANVDMVRGLGADVVIDYKRQAFEDTVRGYDAVFETLGGDNQKRSYRVLKPGGKLVSIVGVPTANWARKQGLPWFLRVMFKLLNRGNDKLAARHKVEWDQGIPARAGQGSVALQPDRPSQGQDRAFGPPCMTRRVEPVADAPPSTGAYPVDRSENLPAAGS
jgi:NADPH:quinone reductase-like Zn-dependent oxidoreductase